jgi:putative CocE/NonD family hydrolase
MDEVKEHSGLAVPMRDGVALATDVYAPVRRGRWPVLLRRTPYDRRAWAPLARAVAQRGYVVAVQDVRGRHASAGDFAFGSSTTDSDFADGYDSVEWAAAYDLSDGAVGMWGHSYDAWTGWRAAAAAPPHLRGVMAAAFPMRSLDVSHGILDIGRRLNWYYRMAVDARRRAGRTDGPLDETLADRVWVEIERWKWLWQIPLDSIPEHVFAGLTSDLRAHMRGIAREQFALDELHARVRAPMFIATGWWDRMVSSIDNYSGLVATAPAALRGAHRLLVGPWGHQPPTWETSRRGSVDLGPESVRSYVGTLTDWADCVLKGAPVTGSGPVELFIVNDGWRRVAAWPPPEAQPAELYLHSAGAANGAWGHGRLGWEIPGDEPVDRYDYDPHDPVMSLMEANAHWAPYDQALNDHRADKLVYRTEPLARAVELIGQPTLALWAASDARDTDWVVRIIDEPPDGPAFAVSEGILRARYRDGYEHPRELVPGEVERFEIALTPLGTRFPAGHRIRLDITSSDFPNYDRNHNTGRDYWCDDELRTARQTVLHDRARPSHLVVPLVA